MKAYKRLNGLKIGKSMEKGIVRLTEADLHKMIMESAKGVLKEMGRYENKKSKKTIKEAWKLPPSQQYDQVEDKDEMRIMNKNMPNPQEENESFKNNQNYSHFAVNKATNKIVNGWDYSEYDPSELRQFKKDYFDVDMVDYGFNPRDYKIVTSKYLLRQGIDPDDNNNWANS